MKIKNRYTNEIMCKGLSLNEVIENHKKWLNNAEGGECANLRDADLRDADLSGADLRGADLRGADLSNSNLRDADLRDADLRGADLINADLSGADLRGPPSCLKIENIHQKIYQAASKEGALDMRARHKDGNACGTTHCRAGWVVHLAGDAGQVLEYAYGTQAAAAIIYMLSDPKLEKMPNFYCDDKTALEDMKRLAEGK
jgi:hypothetical protein